MVLHVNLCKLCESSCLSQAIVQPAQFRHDSEWPISPDSQLFQNDLERPISPNLQFFQSFFTEMAQNDLEWPILPLRLGKDWKSWKFGKIGHSEPLWWEKIGKVANWTKLAILSHSEPFGGKRLEKL